MSGELIDQPTLFILDDGGRAAAGRRGRTGDCVVRAIAIATGLPYMEVYDTLHQRGLSDRKFMAKLELRYGANARRQASPRTGVSPSIYRPWLAELGWEWVPTMSIGSGCRVHLRAGELPDGRLICRLSRHLSAVLDKRVHDTFDPSRQGTRCVYGWWQHPADDPVYVTALAAGKTEREAALLAEAAEGRL